MKIHENGIIEWHHKDGGRMYWGVKAIKTGEVRPAWEGAPESETDEEWAYEIYRGSACPDTLVSGGHLWLQCGVRPNVETFFNDWVASLIPVATGFAKSTEEWYGQAVPLP